MLTRKKEVALPSIWSSRCFVHATKQQSYCCVACKLVAGLASSFNIPMITWVATDPELNNKEKYATLGQLLDPTSRLPAFLLKVFALYNWKRIALIRLVQFIVVDILENTANCTILEQQWQDYLESLHDGLSSVSRSSTNLVYFQYCFVGVFSPVLWTCLAHRSLLPTNFLFSFQLLPPSIISSQFNHPPSPTTLFTQPFVRAPCFRLSASPLSSTMPTT